MWWNLPYLVGLLWRNLDSHHPQRPPVLDHFFYGSRNLRILPDHLALSRCFSCLSDQQVLCWSFMAQFWYHQLQGSLTHWSNWSFYGAPNAWTQSRNQVSVSPVDSTRAVWFLWNLLFLVPVFFKQPFVAMGHPPFGPLIGCIISRIYVGVHFPSDVLGGFCVGLSWLLLTYPYYLQKTLSGASRVNSKRR